MLAERVLACYHLGRRAALDPGSGVPLARSAYEPRQSGFRDRQAGGWSFDLGRERTELRDRYGPIPAPTEWMLRLAEIRLLAARWQLATVHLEPPAGTAGENYRPKDVVLGYRNRRRIERLAKRSDGRLRIVDGASAYFRLKSAETEPKALYACLKDLLRLPLRSL